MEGDLHKHIDVQRKAYEDGKVAFYTEEGLNTIKIKDLLDQPTEGVLYDLNRDNVTVGTIFPTQLLMNEMALINTFKYLHEYYIVSKKEKGLFDKLTQYLFIEEPDNLFPSLKKDVGFIKRSLKRDLNIDDDPEFGDIIFYDKDYRLRKADIVECLLTMQYEIRDIINGLGKPSDYLSRELGMNLLALKRLFLYLNIYFVNSIEKTYYREDGENKEDTKDTEKENEGNSTE